MNKDLNIYGNNYIVSNQRSKKFLNNNDLINLRNSKVK